MTLLVLLGTAGCHLCEEAEEILNACLLTDSKLIVEAIDIAEQESWQEKYAIRIPVVYHPESQHDLGWPFDLEQLQVFIEHVSVVEG
jgi:hypothetical protein